MRRVLVRLGGLVVAIERRYRRGASLWFRAPVGVQVGWIVGLLLADNVTPDAPWAALVLFLSAIPGWTERITPGVLKRLGATLRRVSRGWLFVPASYAAFHVLIALDQLGGDEALTVGVLVFLAPFVLSVLPEPRADGARPATSMFISPPIDRVHHGLPSIMALLGGSMAIVGTVLPWAWVDVPGVGHLGTVGLESPVSAGTLGFGVAIVLSAALRIGARGHAGLRRGVEIGLGLGLASFAWWAMVHLPEFYDHAGPGSVSIGIGLALIAIGGLLAFASGVMPGRPTSEASSSTLTRAAILR